MKRKVKRYAGEDESLVETSAIESPEYETKSLDARPDVEGMKKGIAGGTPTDRPTARELQSSKAAEIHIPSKKHKTSRYSGTVKASDLGSQGDFKFSSKESPKAASSGMTKGQIAAGLGMAAAAGAGALGGRRSMKEGTRAARSEPTMGSTRSPVRSISSEEAAWEGEGGRSYKKGGKAKKMASGGKTSSASSRADGIAQRGKTRGKVF